MITKTPFIFASLNDFALLCSKFELYTIQLTPLLTSFFSSMGRLISLSHAHGREEYQHCWRIMNLSDPLSRNLSFGIL